MKFLTSYYSKNILWRGRKFRSNKISVLISLLILTYLVLICSEPSLAQATKNHNLPVWGVEAVGIIAGFGTTFSSVPDLIMMLRKRSTEGNNPRMAGICAIFQCLWLVYGFLLPSPSLIFWNIIAIITNSTTVWAFFYFSRTNGDRPNKNQKF